MQRLWQGGIDWDGAVPREICERWQEVCDELSSLNEISFDRRVFREFHIRNEIHGFCDASEKTYGACIYIRSIDISGKISTNLLCAKNKIAPLKTISLPKLELCAAELLCKLLKAVLNSSNDKIKDLYMWTDSSIVIQWINTEPYKLNTFVANRVTKIREKTTPTQWRHVRSEDNAADVLSRGQLPKDLLKNVTWQAGPKWLSEEQEYWPRSMISLVPLLEDKSLKMFTNILHEFTFIRRVSKFNKLIRIAAYVLRFTRNVRKTQADRLSGSLQVKELNDAEIFIVRLVQAEVFDDDLKALRKNKTVGTNSKMRALHPFLDENGLIRVGGRLKNSGLAFSEKHPLILPKDHHVTTLIIREIHVKNYHSGVQITLNEVRSQYWPVNGKCVVKRIIHECITCFRAKPRDAMYFMGDLPGSRVTPSRPFLNSGVNYCGPFFIKEKKFRNRNKVKAYLCVFVCFATKAVHFESITDLTSDAFIAGLRRFFARRGAVLNVYSDNATNFIGAKNTFENIVNVLQKSKDWENVAQFLNSKQVNWHFSPPNSPHFGGIWEAAVKSFKNHFVRTVGEKLFTYEEFFTYATEIEAVLNSRPLTPLSTDPNDLRPITPAHFLIGERFTDLLDHDYISVEINKLTMWQHVQFVKQNFWKRWSKEYLHHLMMRSKWQILSQPNIKPGTMVLLKEDKVKPLYWPIGRIVETFPGEDGVVRIVRVKTSSGVYKRSITRVAPLPIE